ncbi:MAG: glycosyltransferase [Pseudomonadales bacterium]|nr:glycosyltransferase [Pseudomonadales bacterium]
MRYVERMLIRHAKLGMFHGRETFEYYAPYCQNPQLVHDVHLTRDDHISQITLERKVVRASEGPINIVYAGRADEMKGARDWLAVLAELVKLGVDFKAEWLGDGPLLAEMRSSLEPLGLVDRVNLRGFVSDRSSVLDALRDAHVMLFCHKTPESPRCLIEALASGCPIVGYESPYPADLIAIHGGGHLVRRDDIQALSQALATLAEDRVRLGKLIACAAQDGAKFDDESVFEHRAELILRHLTTVESH